MLGFLLPIYDIIDDSSLLGRGFAEINAGLKEAFAAIPQFRTPGERDGLRNSWTQNGSWLQSEEIYTYVGRYNEGATYGSTSEGYCYRDFDEKKLRVICLNTSENGQNFDNVSEPQQLWLVWPWNVAYIFALFAFLKDIVIPDILAEPPSAYFLSIVPTAFAALVEVLPTSVKSSG